MNITPDMIEPLGPEVESEVIHQDEADETRQINITPDMIEELGPNNHISGTLDPNKCRCYGPWNFEEGDTARVKLTWSPGSSTLFVGMCNLSGHCWGYAVTGGTCDVTLVCPVSGQYYICICNEGSVTIEYDGEIII